VLPTRWVLPAGTGRPRPGGSGQAGAAALLPYVGWNAFALVLNTRIAVLNRDGRGR
jgi:hypothetical protein